MVSRRAGDAHPHSKKDAGQDDNNSSDSGDDSFPVRLVLVRHDRLNFSSLRAVTCKPLDNHGCLKFCEFSRTGHISISPPTAFPLVPLALQSTFCLHHSLSSLIAGASGRLGGYETGLWSKATVMGLTVSSRPRLSGYSFPEKPRLLQALKGAAETPG